MLFGSRFKPTNCKKTLMRQFGNLNSNWLLDNIKCNKIREMKNVFYYVDF